MNPRLELYPRVPPPSWPPTWEDVERLARVCPEVHGYVLAANRGHCTRDEALIGALFQVYAHFATLYRMRVDDLASRFCTSARMP